MLIRIAVGESFVCSPPSASVMEPSAAHFSPVAHFFSPPTVLFRVRLLLINKFAAPSGCLNPGPPPPPRLPYPGVGWGCARGTK